MLELNVCIGSSCHVKGSYNIIQTFQQIIEDEHLHDAVEMKAQFCMKQCQNGVSVMIEDAAYSVSPETARQFFRDTVAPKIAVVQRQKGVQE
jgi:NADH:ubiquinone oxidoreductase subunit E